MNKVYRMVAKGNGNVYPNLSNSDVRDMCPAVDKALVLSLTPGRSHTDKDGDLWECVANSVLQDDNPLTPDDVAICRESALRVNNKLRRERIATAALAGLCGNSYYTQNRPISLSCVDIVAQSAVEYADALIAELDKVK